MQDNIIRIRHVCELTGLSRSTILRKEAAGLFPPRAAVLPVGVAGWLERDVREWLKTRSTKWDV